MNGDDTKNNSGATRTWPISDHFDGKRFFNPSLPRDSTPALTSVFKMWREPRASWPRSVENKGVPQPNAPRTIDEIAVTFVNHATFLIQVDGIAILTDPIWSDRASMVSWAGPKQVRKPGVAFDDLPHIDLVLLSHNHYDHLDLRTLKRLRQAFSANRSVAAGDAQLVGPLGFKEMNEHDWWDETIFREKLKVTFVPAQHFSARGLHDRDRSLWGGYVIGAAAVPSIRRRFRIFKTFLGYQIAARASRYRDAWHRRI